MPQRQMAFWGVIAAMILATPSVSRAQVFFEASWLQLKRDNDGSAPFVTGPESISAGNVDYSSTPGYRLTLGSGLGDFQIDASFSQLDTWEGHGWGSFTGPILFGDAPPLTNTLPPSFGLATAARYVNGGVDETTENQLLRAGARYTIDNRANYQDFEINIGSRRELRRWRLSAGYRQIRLDERGRTRLRGTFDAPDVGTGFVFGDVGNLPNDGLSHDALLASGFLLIAGMPDGFDSADSPEGPDRLELELFGAADNELHGFQVTGAFRVVDGMWFSVEAIGKAGIYRNSINAAVRETVTGSWNDDSAYLRTLDDRDHGAAFAGNLGLRGMIGLTESVSLIGGYEVLFLSGVALSSDQTRGLRTNALGETLLKARSSGSVIAHGGNLGLEFLW